MWISREIHSLIAFIKPRKQAECLSKEQHCRHQINIIHAEFWHYGTPQQAPCLLVPKNQLRTHVYTKHDIFTTRSGTKLSKNWWLISKNSSSETHQVKETTNNLIVCCLDVHFIIAFKWTKYASYVTWKINLSMAFLCRKRELIIF